MRVVSSVLLSTLSALLLLGSGITFAAMNDAEPLQRATDRQVQRLIEATARDTKAFGKALPSDFKRSVLKGPTGEVAVAHYLDDLNEDIKKLDQRFKPDYSASAEVTALLTRAALLHVFMRAHPEMKGANDWDVVARDLTALAVDYGATFPLIPDTAVRRISDREIENAAKLIAANNDKTRQQLKSAANKLPDLKAPSAGILTSLDELTKATKELRSRLDADKPATAEARIIAARTGTINTFLSEHAVALPVVVSTWNEAAGSRNTLAQAFGLAAE